jgi:hypothetical protein
LPPVYHKYLLKHHENNTSGDMSDRICPIIDHGMGDGANETNDYLSNPKLLTINDPLLPDFHRQIFLIEPLATFGIRVFEGQSGVILEEYPEFLSPVGVVSPFSLQLDMSGAA